MALHLTKEYLIERGVTNVTEDGRIFKGNYEMSQFKVTAKHPYGNDKSYKVILMYDPETYERQQKNNTKRNSRKYAPGQRTLLVHRIVYAWYHNECPKGYDIDHIDGDQFNNNINNLQAITRQENLAKRKAFQGYSPLKMQKLYKTFKEECLKYDISEEEIVDFKEFAKIYRDYEHQETFLEDMIEQLKKTIKETE